MKDMKTGIELITTERARQIESEGWTAEHDDVHNQGQLVKAAIVYAAHGGGSLDTGGNDWPWENSWLKMELHLPNFDRRIKLLTKAGALIAAEIDRVQRLRVVKG